MQAVLKKMTILEALLLLLHGKLNPEKEDVTQRESVYKKIEQVYEGAGHKTDIHDTSVSQGVMQAKIALSADIVAIAQYDIVKRFMSEDLPPLEKVQTGSLFYAKDSSERQFKYFVVPNGVTVHQVKLEDETVICVPQNHKLVNIVGTKSTGDAYTFNEKKFIITNIL